MTRTKPSMLTGPQPFLAVLQPVVAIGSATTLMAQGVAGEAGLSPGVNIVVLTCGTPIVGLWLPDEHCQLKLLTVEISLIPLSMSPATALTRMGRLEASFPAGEASWDVMSNAPWGFGGVGASSCTVTPPWTNTGGVVSPVGFGSGLV